MLGKRHVGAFIQNTLKPCIEELDKILIKCERLKVDPESLRSALFGFMELQYQKCKWKCITNLILGAMFCLVVWLILGGK